MGRRGSVAGHPARLDLAATPTSARLETLGPLLPVYADVRAIMTSSLSGQRVHFVL